MADRRSLSRKILFLNERVGKRGYNLHYFILKKHKHTIVQTTISNEGKMVIYYDFFKRWPKFHSNYTLFKIGEWSKSEEC